MTTARLRLLDSRALRLFVADALLPTREASLLAGVSAELLSPSEAGTTAVEALLCVRSLSPVRADH